MSEASHLINIREILRSKLGTKSRFVPGFAVRWLERIVHEDELNEFIMQEGDIVGVQWLRDCLDYLDTKVIVEGRENLPSPSEAGRYVFVSNHPLGGQDGVALGAVLGEHFNGHIKYLVNDLLMYLKGLAPLCVPINKTGKQSRRFPELVRQTFESDDAIIMFPAGLCSRKINGRVKDLPWQKAFIVKAVEKQRDVVPIYFEGRNSEKFYRLANVCKRLHLKVNIAMLFLADEMFKNKHKTFKIRIGKPISYTTFDKSKSPKEWAKYVQDVVYSMEGENQ